DGDGDDDIYFFDKAGQIHLALRQDADGSLHVAPELVTHFPPETVQWIALRDFDQDGTHDIFSYAPDVDGIRVYRGARRNDGLLSFSLIDFGDPLPQLYTPAGGGRSPLFVSNIDYPAFDDIDFDGDLDILTFAVNGGFLEYYQNLSVERGFGTDTLIYELVDQCWGGFFESGISTALDLAPGPGDCFDNLTAPGSPGRPRHSGSTILSLDYDGNGRKDIMLGDISFRFLVLGLNNGTIGDAWISEQDSTWNTNDVPVSIPSFPLAFHLDIDQDGDRDILASPSVTLNGEDTDVMWYYRNEGSDAAPDFNFVQPNLFVDQMVDVGTSASVAVFDADADGRPDLVVGNNDQFSGTNLLDSRLRLLRNVTPPGGAVAFELVDEDYLGLSRFVSTTWAFAPAFGDLDNDGDEDLILGERTGTLIFAENVAGAGNPPIFDNFQFEWLGLDAGQFSKPFLSDLDRDGKMDLLVGGFDGRVRFYRNVGTDTSPAFAPETAATGNLIQLGGINVNTPGVSTGHPTPWVIQNPDYTLVLAGNRSGKIEAYRFGIDSAYTDPFSLLTKSAGGLDVGAFANPGFGDFDGDGVLEMVVGNERGGLNFFGTSLKIDGTTGLFAINQPDFEFSVFPNPATDQISIDGLPAGVGQLELLDVAGRQLQYQSLLPNQARTRVQWEVAELPAGVYFLRASGMAGVAVKRVVVR
ncbi:MAG: T9SS type A sorting domain-containing protein, partial [Bacteroidota bacterium]